MGDQGNEHPSDSEPQLGGRDAKWRRGGMERWAGRDGTDKFIKAHHRPFSPQNTQKHGGRASPGPVWGV